jgi:hypothetical protein
MNTENTKKVFDQNAERYVGKFMDVGPYKELFNVFCKEITNKSASILDIAG